MGDEDPCNGACDGGLEVLGEPAASIEPCERSLDNPSARQNLEAFRGIGSFDDFKGPGSEFGQGVLQLVTRIGAVSEDVAQPRIERPDRAEERNCAVPILDVSRMHLQTNEMSRRIGNDVPLAPLDLLARIITARTATFRRLHRLAVDDTCGRARLPTLVLASHDDERVVDRYPRPITRPRVKIPLHSRVRRKLFWKLPPLATRRSNVEQRIHYLADVRLARTCSIEFAAGMNGSINDHSASVASLA